jgi:hypothetical protein
MMNKVNDLSSFIKHIKPMSEQLNSGTYEIIQSRLNEQKNNLIQKLQQLNENRKEIFGGVDFSLIANERISTDHNCVAKDIFSLKNALIFGSNAHLGLQTEINITDVFSIYTINNNRFEPQDSSLISDATFIEEFKNRISKSFEKIDSKKLPDKV